MKLLIFTTRTTFLAQRSARDRLGPHRRSIINLFPLPLLILIVHDRERTQPRQNEVSHGRDAARDPQPGRAGRQAELDDEVSRGGRVADDDHVRAWPASHGAHPRDDSAPRAVRVHEERLDRWRG